MNERIRKLAEQATEYANEQNELHGVGYVITFKEKFAELIVRECANVAADHDALDIYEEIREHFGVEE
jgi:hypothetical protein